MTLSKESCLLTVSDPFDADFSVVSDADGLATVTLHAHSRQGASTMEMTLSWEYDILDIHAIWSPGSFREKCLLPNWSRYYESDLVHNAPLLTALSFDDRNRITIACSDAKNRVGIKCGVIEENARLTCVVRIQVNCSISEYCAQVRVDTRDLPFSESAEDAVKWWETFEGFTPARVPETARLPLYSAWYSFHQNIDIPRILEECRYFRDLGCDSLIIDDGWQCDNNHRGYAWCGDWEPTPTKVPDMKAFVDAVHEAGLKFILWYGLPFMGVHAKQYERWKDKALGTGSRDTLVLDPRYPEVRRYLIDRYRQAVLDWGLDGFKLDFIDSFHQVNTVAEGMDFVSVYDAVDQLMKDILASLRELNPDILIEFRQSYIGPLMRTFGNMLRAGDCPNDSLTNRLSTLSLRLSSGSTAVHSDMVMWNYDEPAELAAFQLTNVLFAVPQISVLHDRMPAEHADMVRQYLRFWREHRRTLLDGKLLVRGYAANFEYVSARLDNEQIGAVYSGRIATVEVPTDSVILLNASKNRSVLVEGLQGSWTYSVSDCCGRTVSQGEIRGASADDLNRIDAPVNGYVFLSRI